MTAPIRLIAFDLYGTLLDLGSLIETVRPFTPMPEAMCDAWRQRQLQLANAVTSAARYTDFDRITLTALHEVAPRFHMRLQPAATKQLIDAWAQLPAFGDVVPALNTVFKTHLPMVIVTNAVPSTARNAIAHAGIDEYFSHLFSADAVKTYKPKKAVYDQVTALGVEPAEVLMISANDWDAMGARQAGFHSVFVNRRRAGLARSPERTIEDLHELDHVLSQFSLSAF